MFRRLFLWAALAFAVAGPLSAADPNKEYIIVSGGVSLHVWEKWKSNPHDGWWLNFIRAARIRIQQIQQEQGPDAKITWFVYSDAYKTRQKQENQDLFSIITSVRDAYRVKLIYLSRTRELIDYLNSGQNRAAVKIANFEFFGHSNKACFMFDYSNSIDSASKVWLHEDELKQIRRGIFARDAFVKSWGCHTGESFSRKWYAATGVRMWGAIGKTQYQTEELPTLSSAGASWTR
ncbi:MAG: hypothetical protein M3463_00245 [Verrucomicrobiota bacterium]|nr:hypothetical protein [Verrucomicrobiota bacterium]